MPHSAEFELELVASPADVDELGHVSNLTYLRWVQEVALAHSAAVGWDWDAYKRAGTVFVVRRHELDYLRPAYAGESIVLVTWIESWSAASSERRTRVLRREGEARVELLRASTLWALVSVESGRPTRIPPEIRDAFLAPAPAP